MSGYIYVLSNPSMPDLLKIGHSKATPEARMKQLSSTGVPASFILQCCFCVRDPMKVERQVHLALAHARENPSREFFRTTVSEFLRLALPIIGEDLDSNEEIPESSKPKTHNLSELEVQLLQVIVNGGDTGANRNIFMWGHPRIEQDDMSITIALANLHEAKLVKKSRATDSYDPFWIATPKGIKLLADHSLIAAWMR